MHCAVVLCSSRSQLSWPHTVVRPAPASQTKAIFTPRLGETSPLVAEGYIQEGLDWLTKYRHPDPYIAPTKFGGSKYMRNSPPPHSVC